MTEQLYELIGFVSPADEGPSFATPIFSRDHRFYVQGLSRDERVIDFEEYPGAVVDIVQVGPVEHMQVNSDVMYCVLNRKRKPIYGSKPYVARFLSQTLRDYIDSPFFLIEACKFTNASVPEAYHLLVEENAFDMQIIANSIYDFVILSDIKMTITQHLDNSVSAEVPICVVDIYYLTSKYSSFSALLSDWRDRAYEEYPRLRQHRLISKCVETTDWLLPEYIDSQKSNTRLVQLYLSKLFEDIVPDTERSIPEIWRVPAIGEIDIIVKQFPLKRGDHSQLAGNIKKERFGMRQSKQKASEVSFVVHVFSLIFTAAMKISKGAPIKSSK